MEPAAVKAAEYTERVQQMQIIDRSLRSGLLNWWLQAEFLHGFNAAIESGMGIGIILGDNAEVHSLAVYTHFFEPGEAALFVIPGQSNGWRSNFARNFNGFYRLHFSRKLFYCQFRRTGKQIFDLRIRKIGNDATGDGHDAGRGQQLLQRGGGTFSLRENCFNR